MASSGFCQVQDSLSCGVCFERYDGSTHLPKILPCQHTLCCSCIDSLIDADFLLNEFECPLCRCQVTSDDVHTNLAVKDIVEAIAIEENAKLFCPKHPAKECQLVCTDCYQPLCTICVQGLTKGEHKGHNIDDVDGAKVAMKKSLTSTVEKKIEDIKKATATKKDKLAHYEKEVQTVICIIIEVLNEWQKLQTVINKELETSKAEQESWARKLEISDLKSMMTACKEAKAEGGSTLDISLPRVNLDELQNKVDLLNIRVQALNKDNNHLHQLSSPPLTPTSNTDENHTSWDFILHLCNSAVPQEDPSKRPYIPPCVQRVANMYNRNRNMQFLRVVHDKRKGHDTLICRTDDFIYKYDCSESREHIVDGVWNPRMSLEVGFLEKWKDVLHDPEYAIKIINALETWKGSLHHHMRNGRPEILWEFNEE